MGVSNLGSKDGDYNRHKFFEQDLKQQRWQHMTDAEINALKGGHDFRSFMPRSPQPKRTRDNNSDTRQNQRGLAWALRQSKMTLIKPKLDIESLLEFRDRFDLPLNDDQVRRLEFVKPPNDSTAIQYQNVVISWAVSYQGGFSTLLTNYRAIPMTVYASLQLRQMVSRIDHHGTSADHRRSFT